jgi:hypothetical protein
MDHVRPLSSVTGAKDDRERRVAHPDNPWPLGPAHSRTIAIKKKEAPRG